MHSAQKKEDFAVLQLLILIYHYLTYTLKTV
jgi:hypothetical protein